jgi:signal transduction histidine kinase
MALSNLVKNAVEALADQPEHVRVVDVVTAVVCERVRLEVRDEGVGVPARVASSLFEPLVSTKHDGMGLGLAITRTIVEAHRGTLTLVPTDRGAVFRIELPATGG